MLAMTQLVGFGGVDRDQYFSSTTLILHCDGADTSTTFVDTSPSGRTCAAAGNAQVDTAQQQFGTGSVLLDGTGDWVQVNTVSGLCNFGSADFTVEMWVRWTTTPSAAVERRMFYASDHSSGNKRPTLTCFSNQLLFGFFGTNVASSAALSWNANQWYHLAASRVSSTTKLFRDGTQVASAADSNVYIDSATSYRVGDQVIGWIDDVRVTNGVGRYSAAFTPPSQPFQDQ